MSPESHLCTYSNTKGRISMYIYQITNNVTHDCYVGKTVIGISQRFSSHKYNAKKNKSQAHLYRAMRKYGIENFNVIEIDQASNIQELNEKEILWIKKINPRYNMTQGGDGGDNSKTINFIESMKKYHSNKDPKSYATYGMLGKKTSEETKKLIGMKNSCPVMCEGLKFNSVSEAQKSFPGISIRKRLDNKKYPTFFRLKPKRKYN